jgi:hypothetical protein
MVYVGLHSGNPGTGVAQSTLETGYAGYARQPVMLSTAGLYYKNPAQILFPVSTDSGAWMLLYVSIGTALSGGTITYSGALWVPVNVIYQKQVTFQAGALQVLMTSGTMLPAYLDEQPQYRRLHHGKSLNVLDLARGGVCAKTGFTAPASRMKYLSDGSRVVDDYDGEAHRTNDEGP